jgi:hypothetical protein
MLSRAGWMRGANSTSLVPRVRPRTTPATMQSRLYSSILRMLFPGYYQPLAIRVYLSSGRTFGAVSLLAILVLLMVFAL